MKELIYTLLNTRDCRAALISRLALGIVMFPHAAQKLLGWFGGSGLQRTMEYLTQTLHLSPSVAYAVILGEFLASIALILGVFSRLAAATIIAIMMGAIGMVHYNHGFFMNWMGQQKGEGFEYHLLALGLALAVLVAGGGKASIDRWLASGCCCHKNFDPNRPLDARTGDKMH